MGRKNKKANKEQNQNSKGKSAASNNTHPPADGPAHIPTEDDLDADYVHYTSDEENNDNRIIPAEASDGKKRIRTADSSEEDSDDDSESGAELGLNDAAGDESDVNITLDFHDPSDGDVVPITTFLERWTNRAGPPALPVAEVVCAQTRVGTTVRVDEDDAPVAFISVLNIRRYAKLFSDLRKRILAIAPSDGLMARTLKKCLDGPGRFEDEKMGVVLWERVVNLPPLVLPKMLEALFCEVAWAVEDEPTEEGREEFRLGWFLHVTEVMIVQSAGEATGATQSEAAARAGTAANSSADDTKKRKKMKAREAGEEINFTKAEDEAWFEAAADKVSWTIPGAEKEKGGVSRKGMVMLVAASKIPVMRKRVEDMVGFVQENEDMEVDDMEVDEREEKVTT